MSDTAWTREQLEAITQSGCNLLVAAAAGAGKTAVLVERIIRKITNVENPVDIDRLLVVTFTNAAAAEMRERIGSAIEDALGKKPDSPILQRQITLLDRASIMTLHSFCLEVVRNNFHRIDLDPVFRIADETETVLMKLDVLEELFEEKYENGDTEEDFFKLVECYGGGRDDSALQEIVLTLFEFIQSHPWPHRWLEESAGAFDSPDDTELCSTVWGKVLIKSVRAELSGLYGMLERAAAAAGEAQGLEPYCTCLEGDMQQVKSLIEACDPGEASHVQWDSLYRAFAGFELARLPRCGKDADTGAQEAVKAVRKEVRERLGRIGEGTFNATSEDVLSDFKLLYPLFKCLSGLAAEFGVRYAAKKKEKALLDFNDLEHFCLGILVENDSPSSVARALRERYEEILVDEYQDSNLIQEVILNTISRNDDGKPNIFMVGDVKQSIYRFRQAKPELFLAKYHAYPSESGFESRKILLYKNFRSRGAVVNGVNFIFMQIMSALVGELDYTPDEALNPGASFALLEEQGTEAGGPVEVHIVDLDGSPEAVPAQEQEEPDGDSAGNTGDVAAQEADNERLDAIQAEARIVAKRIRQLVEPASGECTFKIYDGRLKEYRKAEYRDIVILLRTTRNWAGIFSEELGLQGIPAYADTGAGYFKTVEVQTVMSLLQILDNPLQDIPLLAVLRSPIGLFSPDELVDIRLVDRDMPFIEAMRKFASDGLNVTADKTLKFLSKLEIWRDKALYLSTDELIWYLYTETAYYSYVGILPGGIQRQANLRVLFERARQYEETSYKGLFNFVNFIDRLKSGGGDMGSAKVLGENENVVRIMSIHKSKGLEFPIVIVSGCGKRFNLQDMNGKILLHQDLGFGPDLVDPLRRITYHTMPKQAIKSKLRYETLSEEMRILYVAFTRAKEKLIITGTVKDFSKTAEGWCRCTSDSDPRLPEFEMLKARNYFDWVGPALARHKSCGILRQTGAIYTAAGFMPEDASEWDIKVWNMKDAAVNREAEKEAGEDLLGWLNKPDEGQLTDRGFEDVKSRLDWEYPLKRSCEIPAKLSVTELKRRFNIELSEEYNPPGLYMQPLIKKPAFMDEARGISAAERGTILHFVMQHLDITEIIGVTAGQSDNSLQRLSDEIRVQTGSMVENELLTAQEAETVDTCKVAAFFDSVLGRRLLQSKVISREIPFNIELRCSEVYPDLQEESYAGETLLLQGVIDCCFEEGDGIVLLDYKTDYVPAAGSAQLKERYRIQIEYYSRALEVITGKKVREKYIYSFWNGEAIGY